MKLYMSPVSTVSRPVSLFIADEGISCEQIAVDIMNGAQQAPDYLAINPNGLVPVLEDDGLVLTESAAILRYLAEVSKSKAYPSDAKERAKVNEALDWMNSNLYKDLGYNLVYPMMFPHHKRRSDEAQEGCIAWGTEKTAHWLSILDQHYIGDSDYICLGRLTIADYFASGLLTLLEAIQFDFSPYPNIQRWMAGLKKRSNWDTANGGYYAMLASFA